MLNLKLKLKLKQFKVVIVCFGKSHLLNKLKVASYSIVLEKLCKMWASEFRKSNFISRSTKKWLLTLIDSGQ